LSGRSNRDAETEVAKAQSALQRCGSATRFYCCGRRAHGADIAATSGATGILDAARFDVRNKSGRAFGRAAATALLSLRVISRRENLSQASFFFRPGFIAVSRGAAISSPTGRDHGPVTS
jgi:hypothetical protein